MDLRSGTLNASGEASTTSLYGDVPAAVKTSAECLDRAAGALAIAENKVKAASTKAASVAIAVAREYRSLATAMRAEEANWRENEAEHKA